MRNKRALRVSCPFCGSAERYGCRTRRGARTDPHKARVKRYEEAGEDRTVSFRISGDDEEDFAAIHAFFGGHPANSEVYEPRESGLIPEPGAWVMIRRKLPALEGGVDDHFRIGRIFWVERGEFADGRLAHPWLVGMRL